MLLVTGSGEDNKHGGWSSETPVFNVSGTAIVLKACHLFCRRGGVGVGIFMPLKVVMGPKQEFWGPKKERKWGG